MTCKRNFQRFEKNMRIHSELQYSHAEGVTGIKDEVYLLEADLEWELNLLVILFF